LTQWDREIYIENILYTSHGSIIGYIFFTWFLFVPSDIAIIFILLFVLLLFGINLNKRWRIFFIVPSSIILFLTTFVLILPKYDFIPSKEDFYNNFKTQLHIVIKDTPMILGDIQAEIVLHDRDINQKMVFPIKESSEIYSSYFISKPLHIEFISTKPLYNTIAFIQFYDWLIIPIPSQSLAEILYNQTWYEFILTGINRDKNIENSSNFISLESDRLKQLYINAYNQFVIDAIGSDRMQYPIVDTVIGMSLYYLQYLFPKYYKKNYHNYKKIKSILNENSIENTDRLSIPENSYVIRDWLAWSVQKTRRLKYFFR
jgi:hypothetical protein